MCERTAVAFWRAMLKASYVLFIAARVSNYDSLKVVRTHQFTRVDSMHSSWMLVHWLW